MAEALGDGIVDGQSRGEQRAGAARIVVGARLLDVRDQHNSLTTSLPSRDLGHQCPVLSTVESGRDFHMQSHGPGGQRVA